MAKLFLKENMKKMKEDKALLVEALKWIRLLVITIILIGVCIFVQRTKQPKEPKLTSSFINSKLEAVSNLTTAELTYTGLIQYSEGNIPILTKNKFSLLYTAKIRAGIDLSQTQIHVTEQALKITLPECEIQSIDIDPDSIEIYDEHFALFNWTDKMDVIDTISAAREDVTKKADIDSILETARTQTVAIIEGLLFDVIEDRELMIQ